MFGYRSLTDHLLRYRIIENGTRASAAPKRIYRRNAYWPPPAEKRSRLIELPSGKKFFVFMGKRDADGKLEPVVCFIDRNGDRLTWFNSEELHQLEQLAPRLMTYFDLWEQKQRE